MRTLLFALLATASVACGSSDATEGGAGNDTMMGAGDEPITAANKEALTASWRGNTASPYCDGDVPVELVVEASGKFTHKSTCNGALSTFTGPWTNPSGSTLRLDVSDYSPKEFCGPLGCTQIVQPTGETHAFSFPNATTLKLVNAECPQDPPCTVQYTRSNP